MSVKLLIISVISTLTGGQYKPTDTTMPDIIILQQSKLKGQFLDYIDTTQTIVFYNYMTKDTDLIDLSLINYFYYNSLPLKHTDTLFTSFKNYQVGKILAHKNQKIVFWNKSTAKIEVYYDRKFLNYNHNPLNMNILVNPVIRLSIAVFALLAAISVLLSKDFYNSLVFISFAIFTAWSYLFTKTKIWKK